MLQTRRIRLFLWGASACLVLAACGSSSKHATAPSTTRGTVAVTTTSAPPTVTTNTEVLPTTNSLPCQPLPPPVTPLKSPAPVQAVSLTTVSELGDSCVDHVAFGFRSSSSDPPGYELTYGTPPFVSDGSGAPINVAGTAFIVVKVRPGYGFDVDSGQPTYTGSKRIVPAHANHVTEIVETGDFEGVLGWVIGLDQKRPFSVQATGAPQTQLVVTVG